MTTANKAIELKKVFTVAKELNGPGPVLFAWHPDGSYLACAGTSRIVNVSNRQGEAVAEIPLQGCVRASLGRRAGGAHGHAMDMRHARARTPVSYTHLTLPTKRIV